MSVTIKMRIDEELLAAVDGQAEADGVNRTQFILAAIRTRLANAPSLDGSTRLPPPKTAKVIAATIPAVKTGHELIREQNEARFKAYNTGSQHHPACKCYTCNPR